MNAKTWLVLGASLGVLGVAAGTFGAHALPDYLEAAGAGADVAKRQNWWEKGVRYQMYHALALLAVAWVADRKMSLLPSLAGVAMFLGTLVFSGCLYALALTGQTFIGAIVPIGGVMFIVGWILLAVAGGRLLPEPQSGRLASDKKLASEIKSMHEEVSPEHPANKPEGNAA